ncbi:MAG: sugar phosphate isomerase/epimerase [Paracoccus sp. (in: a-proteobacteria)]|nr:sugar phosphate isomerase/epimerase [Paracoccus sp. (in: a-proteobacteria)]
MINAKSAAFAALAATMALPGAASAQARAAADLPIAVQLFTLRDHGTLEERLAAVQAAGVTAVETVGTHDLEAAEFKALLDAHGIEPIATHAPIAALREDISAVASFNKAIGNEVIIVPFLAEDMRPADAAGWVALGEELRSMSDALRAEGMVLGYHNHAFEMVEFDGRTALEIMFEAAGPDLLAEIDVAWVARGGLDPAEYLGRFDGRLFAIHAKDNAPEGEAEDERGFKALGEGVLDWSTILPAAEAAGADWYIIEHDMPLDAAVVVQTGADFLSANLPEGVSR